jgi:predicted amidophosphoribosyltransferase
VRVIRDRRRARVRKVARIFARRLATMVAPPRCAACGSTCDTAAILCARCETELEKAPPLLEPGPPGIRRSVAASRFEGAARQVAHGLKYGRRLALAEVAARAMLTACPPAELRGAVVPVPPAPWRWRWRGFDPAEEIAATLSRLAGLPHRACLKRGGGPRQVGRRRSQRLADPPRVWAVREVPRLAILVDDVHTTGATLSACAAALRARGTRDVTALTLARAL